MAVLTSKQRSPASAGAKPADMPITLKTPGHSDLLFRAMTATEELGRPFALDIEAVSPVGTIKPEDLLGKPASVSVELPSTGKRHFHGLVCAMGTGGADRRMFGYRMTLRPWLWLLTRRTDTRVFQSMTVEAILKKVFEPFSPDYEFRLEGALPEYEYCVQYRETDFDFASRLMEQEGIYYFFRHAADKHTMVIVNTPGAHPPNPGQATFEFREAADALLDFEPITQWTTSREIQPAKVVLRDYDFKQPRASLEATASAARQGGSATLEHYDYPGVYADGAAASRYSRLRMEELQARYSRIEGAGAIRNLVCGHRFTLKAHPRADQNRAHVVLASRIQLVHGGYESGQGETSCRCQFTAIEGDELFRPQRTTPKPTVRGLHTAVVVGPAGQEIHTDAHGRVKVQFHWDRLGKRDEKSSCWVRVATPWAGQNWGMIAIPRIGQEVVVDFLEGDPDRPLVTGQVYNGEQKPPYLLPDNATVSTSKSRSSKGGAAGNFNELRFEDRKGSEYVWLQAEKDFHQLVKNDATLLVGANQDRIVRNNLTEQIDGAVRVRIGKDSATEVAGSHSVKVTQDAVLESMASISQKAAANLDIQVGANLATDAAGNVHIKAGANLVIEGGVMVTLKAAGSSVVIGPEGVSITGAMVLVNSGGAPGSGGGANAKAALATQAPAEKADPLA
jgi:type VI secretion system secreted protein VgrG